ncbi:hypothetical protein GN956_G10771 [Arapaima gigas]
MSVGGEIGAVRLCVGWQEEPERKERERGGGRRANGWTEGEEKERRCVGKCGIEARRGPPGKALWTDRDVETKNRGGGKGQDRRTTLSCGSCFPQGA